MAPSKHGQWWARREKPAMAKDGDQESPFSLSLSSFSHCLPRCPSERAPPGPQKWWSPYLFPGEQHPRLNFQWTGRATWCPSWPWWAPAPTGTWAYPQRICAPKSAAGSRRWCRTWFPGMRAPTAGWPMRCVRAWSGEWQTSLPGPVLGTLASGVRLAQALSQMNSQSSRGALQGPIVMYSQAVWLGLWEVPVQMVRRAQGGGLLKRGSEISEGTAGKRHRGWERERRGTEGRCCSLSRTRFPRLPDGQPKEFGFSRDCQYFSDTASTPTASKSGAIRKLGVEQSRTDVGKLWFGTKPGALESGLTHFDPMLSGAAFSLQIWLIATDTAWAMKPKIFTTWPSADKHSPMPGLVEEPWIQANLVQLYPSWKWLSETWHLHLGLVLLCTQENLKV